MIRVAEKGPVRIKINLSRSHMPLTIERKSLSQAQVSNICHELALLRNKVETVELAVGLPLGNIPVSYDEIKKDTIIEPLTGLYNARYYKLRLQEEVECHKRHHRGFALMTIDIDLFKEVNDTHGHAAGDCALRVIAGIMKKAVRGIDIVCRWGGEEFGVILPETTVEEAAIVAERIRKDIEKAEIRISPQKSIQKTVSIGIAEIDQVENPENPEEIQKLADKKVYEAKQSGRNRVVYTPALIEDKNQTNSAS